VLLLTDDPQAVRALWDYSNAWGVLSIDASAQELEAAVLALSQGLWVGDAYLVRQILANQALAGQPTGLAAELPAGQALTGRELKVLQGLSQGLANKQIGLALGISEHTVKFHVSAIYTKLGASNRTEAVRLGVQRGLVTL
jgi:DNA-binding NarL/FixJ family response regulator